MTARAADLDAPQKAAWLLGTPFYQSLVSRLRNEGHNPEDKRIKKGHFSILCEFLPKLNGWLFNALDKSIDTDKLVMTFSNVNPDVVSINAQAIGISDFPRFKAIKLGRLNDLVGQRNDIGHGAVIQPPSHAVFEDLWDFTEALINEYCDVFVDWMRTEFSVGSDEELNEDVGTAMLTDHW